MDDMGRVLAPLVLLIDEDPATRALLQPVLRPYGLEIVQARASAAALELLQRVAGRFRLVVVSLEMPGLSGAVLLETLRIFKPGVAAICLTATAHSPAGGENGCLARSLGREELQARVAGALARQPGPAPAPSVAPDVVARARSAFAASASLLDAARELARGMADGSASDW
jgi:DNA-binding response OmpR family regulator